MGVVGPEVFAVLAGMLGVSLIAGSRLRARRRAPAAPTMVAAAAPTGRWGESRMPVADFDDWHEEEAPRAVAAPAAVATPPLEELDDDALDDVFAGREPASGRFAQPAPAAAPLVPDARSVFGETPAPRGGAAGFRSAPRRTGLAGLLGSPAFRAAAYAVAGIALVALIVNVALGGGSEPAAERATSPAPAAEAPAPVPAVTEPSVAERAAERVRAVTEFELATDAAATAATRARAAERRAARRRRAAAAKRRREAAARRRAAQQAPAPPAPVQPSPPAPSAPSTGGGGGGGDAGGGGGRAPRCELGCIG